MPTSVTTILLAQVVLLRKGHAFRKGASANSDAFDFQAPTQVMSAARNLLGKVLPRIVVPAMGA